MCGRARELILGSPNIARLGDAELVDGRRHSGASANLKSFSDTRPGMHRPMGYLRSGLVFMVLLGVACNDSRRAGGSNLDLGSPLEDAAVLGEDADGSFDAFVPPDASLEMDGGLPPEDSGSDDAGEFDATIVIDMEAPIDGACTPTIFGEANHAVPTGKAPRGLVLADFNGDGALDFATADTNGGGVTVGLSSAAGFATHAFAAVAYPYALRAGDFDNDGYPDLVVTGISSGASVGILMNDGDGTFQAPRTYVQYDSEDVEVLDANEDGNLDVVAIYPYTSDRNALFLGNGDGTFTRGTNPLVGGHAVRVRTADMNGDGHADLVVADQASSNAGVNIALGRGDGTFAAPSHTTVPISVWSVGLGDFDNDTRMDVIATHSAGHVYWLRNHGDGTLETAVRVHDGGIDSGYGDIVATDLNGDHNLDAVISDGLISISQGDGVLVLLGRGDGAFFPPIEIPIAIGPNTVAVGDIDGDGHPDIATTSQVGSFFAYVSGDGAGHARAGDLWPTEDEPTHLVSGDLNGDGHDDLVGYSVGGGYFIVSEDSDFTPTPSIGFRSPGVLLTDFTGDGLLDLVTESRIVGESLVVNRGYSDGAFGTRVALDAGVWVAALGGGDFDDDGRPDLVTSDSTDSDLSFIFGDGEGGIAETASLDAHVAGNGSLATADFDGDGVSDVAALSGPYLSVRSVAVATSSPTREVSMRTLVVSTTGSLTAIVAADVDHDGDQDLVVTGSGASSSDPSRYFVLTQNASGDFVVGTSHNLHGGISQLLSGDFDTDGDADIVGLGSGVATVFRQSGGALEEPYYIPVAGVSGTLGDFDGDGLVDIAAVRGPDGAAVHVLHGLCR